MNTTELMEQLAQQDQDRYVVLRHPESGLIHSLQFILEEKAAIDNARDYRTGPHGLVYRQSDNDAPILHLGQQGWYGNYPATPDVETVTKLITELRNHDPDHRTVITHHFDEFIDINVITPMDGMSSPMLWGNPGSNVNPWPQDAKIAPPDRVLLISNSENEAYAALRKAARHELETGVRLLLADRPCFKGMDQLPYGRYAVAKKDLEERHQAATAELQDAWRKFAGVVAGE